MTEVYADEKTTAAEMIKQGQEISRWHKRVFVKLPTTVEGFKARTALRQANIPVNNTLVFSQEQVFAICLHELIIQKQPGMNPYRYNLYRNDQFVLSETISATKILNF